MAELVKLERVLKRFGVSKKPEGYEPLKDEELDDLETQMDAATRQYPAVQRVIGEMGKGVQERDDWWRTVGVSMLFVGLFAGAFATLVFFLAPAHETGSHVASEIVELAGGSARSGEWLALAQELDPFVLDESVARASPPAPPLAPGGCRPPRSSRLPGAGKAMKNQ